MIGIITTHPSKPGHFSPKLSRSFRLGKSHTLHLEWEADESWEHNRLILNGGTPVTLLSLNDDTVTIQQNAQTPPVYLTPRGKDWIFAHSRHDLLAFIHQPPLNQKAVASFLTFLHPLPEEDWWQGLRTLAPGSLCWQWKDGEASFEALPAQGLPIYDQDKAALLLESHLRTAISALVPRHQPVGLLLSSGIDSSLLACLLKQAGHNNIITISVQFEGEDTGEVEQARRLATTLGFPHVHETISPLDLKEQLPSFLNLLEEPCGIPSLVATVLISQRAKRRGIRVLISGLGSDELFGGHRKHLLLPFLPLLSRQPRWPKNLLHALASVLPFGNKRGWLMRASDAWGHPAISGYLALCAWLSEKERRELLSQPLPLDLNDILPGQSGMDLSQIMFETDVRGWLEHGILAPLLKTLRLEGLQLLVPFCTPEMLQLSYRLPVSLKVRLGLGKYLLKNLAKELLPPGLGSASRKGFVVPIGRWMSGPLKTFLEQGLTFESVEALGSLRWAGVKKLLSAHSRGRIDRSETLFALLTLVQWHQRRYEVQSTEYNERRVA